MANLGDIAGAFGIGLSAAGRESAARTERAQQSQLQEANLRMLAENLRQSQARFAQWQQDNSPATAEDVQAAFSELGPVLERYAPGVGEQVAGLLQRGAGRLTKAQVAAELADLTGQLSSGLIEDSRKQAEAARRQADAEQVIGALPGAPQKVEQVPGVRLPTVGAIPASERIVPDTERIRGLAKAVTLGTPGTLTDILGMFVPSGSRISGRQANDLLGRFGMQPLYDPQQVVSQRDVLGVVGEPVRQSLLANQAELADARTRFQEYRIRLGEETFDADARKAFTDADRAVADLQVAQARATTAEDLFKAQIAASDALTKLRVVQAKKEVALTDKALTQSAGVRGGAVAKELSLSDLRLLRGQASGEAERLDRQADELLSDPALGGQIREVRQTPDLKARVADLRERAKKWRAEAAFYDKLLSEKTGRQSAATVTPEARRAAMQAAGIPLPPD